MRFATEKERLTATVKDVQEGLDQDRNVKKRRKTYTREYRAWKKLPRVAITEFFCDRCQVDFAVMAYKIWNFYHNKGSWHSVCPDCGVMVMRHISHKNLDPYYEKSSKIRLMRNEYKADMLRPTEYGFQTLYGDPFEHYYKRFQERSEDLHNKYAGLGIRGTVLDEKEHKQALEDDIIEST